MKHYEIIHNLTKNVLISGDYNSLKECVEKNKKCLNHTNLKYADLEGAFLEHTNLKYADVMHANLNDTKLAYSRLDGADLRCAKLEYADLKYSCLERSILKGSNLKYADLEGAFLEHTNLKYANLEGANLEGANLKGANLEHTNLKGANLKGANLDGAYFNSDYVFMKKKCRVNKDTPEVELRKYLEHSKNVIRNFLKNPDTFAVGSFDELVKENSTIKNIQNELDRAEKLWPNWPIDLVHACAIVTEESGELMQACLNATVCKKDDLSKSEYLLEIKKEAIQTGAMVLRFLNNMENYEL